MAGAKGRGLGKGLEALFNDFEISTTDIQVIDQNKLADGSVTLINVNDISPNSKQPRKNFNEEKIEELAKSIQEHGIIQPIMIRKEAEGYEIIAGERRWRAARKAGLKTVPCIIRELTEEQNMLVAIIENMQREDLNPIEEADALNQMITTFGLTQEEVSKSVGKSRPYITNALRLLKLPEEIQGMVVNDELSNGHARAIASLKDEKKQVELAKHVVREGLSVREVEKLVAKTTSEDTEDSKPRPKPRAKNREIIGLEDDLKKIFGTKVSINHGRKKGKIEIEYYSKDELERVLEMLLRIQ